MQLLQSFSKKSIKIIPPNNDTQAIKSKIIGKWQVTATGMSFIAEFFNDGRFKTDLPLIPSGTYGIEGNTLTLVTIFFGEKFTDRSTIKFLSDDYFTLTGETGSFEEYKRIG